MHRVVAVDAHATVQVLRRRDDALARLRHPELRQRHLALRGQAGCDPPAGLERRQPNPLHVDEGIGRTVSHGLEHRDRLVELLALLGVLGGHAKRRIADAEAERAQCRRGAQSGPLEDHAAGSRPAQQRVGCELHAVERQLRGGLTARRHELRERDTRSVRLDQEHRDLATLDARRNQDALRELRSGNRELVAREREAPVPARGRSGRQQRVGLILFQSCSEDGAALGDAWQPGFLLRIAAELHDRERAQHYGFEVGNGRRVLADALEHAGDLGEAEAGAAVGLRQRGADQSALGELLPQLRVEARPLGQLDLALALVRGELREHLAGEVDDRLLVVVVCEVHFSP